MTGKTILTTGLLFMLAACHNNESIDLLQTNHSEATFSAIIRAQNLTRASDASWEAGDMIGISGQSGQKQYVNSAYATASGSGSDFAFSEGMKIYYMDDKEVTFTAYYPWKPELTDIETLSFDAVWQAVQNDFDFLWAQAVGSKERPQVAFGFKHVMSKVVLTMKAGREVTFQQVKGAVCTLEQHLTQGEFNRTTGVVTAGGTVARQTFAGNTEADFNTQDVTENQTQGSITYGLILPPQVFDGTKPLISITTTPVDGQESQNFKAEIDLAAIAENDGNCALKAGVQYNITVNVNSTGLSFGQCSISPWQPASLNVDANLQ